MRLWYQILGGLVLKSLCTWTCFVVMAAELHATELTRPFLHTAFLEGRLTEELVRGHLDAGGSLEEMDHYGHTVLSLAKGEWKSRESYLLEQLGADRERIHQPIYTLVRTFIAGKVEDIPAVLDRWPQYAHLPGLRTSLYTYLIRKLTTNDPDAQQRILGLIDRMIAMGVSVNADDPYVSPLREILTMRMSGLLFTDLAHRFLDQGADVRIIWFENGTPRNLLSQVGKGPSIGEVSVIRGIEFPIRDYASDVALARRLVELGAPLDTPALRASTLISLLNSGNVQLIEFLLGVGVLSPSDLSCSISGWRPIDLLSVRHAPTLMLLFLDAGSPLPELFTLFKVVGSDDQNLEILMQRLFDDGLNIDPTAMIFGRSLLHEAGFHGNIKFISSLLDMGIDFKLNPLNTMGLTPLEVAAIQGYILRHIEANDRSIGIVEYLMITPRILFPANTVDFLGVEQLLLDAGAMPNRLSSDHIQVIMQVKNFPDGSNGPLSRRVILGPREMKPWPKEICAPIAQAVNHGTDAKRLRSLVDVGWDVNAQGYLGRTAIMHAINGGDINVIRALLSLGADPSIADQDGHNAYHYYEDNVERFPQLRGVFELEGAEGD